MIRQDFAKEYSLYTPAGKMNLIGVIENYFEYYVNGKNVGESEHCSEDTKRDYVSSYNKRIFPLIDQSIEADDYSYEMLEDLVRRVQETFDLGDSTIESRYLHLVFGPFEKYKELVEKQNFMRRWGIGGTKDINDFNSLSLKIRKSFTVPEELAIADTILQHADTEEGEICGLAVMWLACTRNNEAAALDFKDIVEMPNHPGNFEILIYKSTVRNSNIRKASGKTENAVRRIPIPDVLYEYLEKRKEYLSAVVSFPLECNGIAYESVEDLPISCRRNEYGNRCSSNNLTNKGRELFRRIGMSEERIEDIDTYMRVRIDSDEDFGERDVTTYTFRRNGGTHLYASALKIQYIQYYMGHKIEDRNYKRTDFGDESMRFEIKQALNHHPFNDYYSEHDTGLCSGEDEELNRIENGITVRGNGGSIYMMVSAKEPGCELKLSVTCKNGISEFDLIKSVSSHKQEEIVDARNVTKKVYSAHRNRRRSGQGGIV